MTEEKQEDQLEHTYSSYVKIRDVAQKTCRRRWTIGRSVKREPKLYVQAARHDDDDDDDDDDYPPGLSEYCRNENDRETARYFKFQNLSLCKRASVIVIPK